VGRWQWRQRERPGCATKLVTAFSMLRQEMNKTRSI
jgi:hypothetical protein